MFLFLAQVAHIWVSQPKASWEAEPGEDCTGRAVWADDRSNRGFRAHGNALKLISLNKLSCCCPVYLLSPHLLHEISYEQKRVAHVFLWQSSDWGIWLTPFLVLSKFFSMLCKDCVKGFISMIILGTQLLFPLSEWHELQEGLWHRSCTGCFMLGHLQACRVGGRGNAILLGSWKARWWRISPPPFLCGV